MYVRDIAEVDATGGYNMLSRQRAEDNHVLMHALGAYHIYQRRGCHTLFCSYIQVS